MKVALIGGTRFIGKHAVERALQRGDEVAVFHRGVHANVTEAPSVHVERSDRGALREALARFEPDVVVDTLAMTRGDAACLLASTKPHTPLVVLSSQDVYAQFGALNGHPCETFVSPVTEDAPLTVPYPFRGIGAHAGGEDYDKKDVEAELEASGRRVTVLRLPAVYGPDDYKRRFGLIVDALDRGERELVCEDEGAFCFTHADVRDVAETIFLATRRRGAFRVYNVGERETPTIRARAEAIAEAMGCTIDWRAGKPSDPHSPFSKMPNDFVADTQRIRDELGYREVVSVESSIQDLVEALRSSRRA